MEIIKDFDPTTISVRKRGGHTDELELLRQGNALSFNYFPSSLCSLGYKTFRGRFHCSKQADTVTQAYKWIVWLDKEN